MSSLAQLQNELESHDNTLKELEEILSGVPDYQEALDMRAETLAKKKETEDKIAALKPATSTTFSNQASPTPQSEKWKKEDHPAFRKAPAATPAPAEEPKTFKVNDTVSAKYAGDKSFYPATIISITGSSAAPIYTVKFKGYNGTETVRGHDVRSISSSSSNNQAGAKRKADGTPVVSSPSMTSTSTINAATTNGSTISAAANIDPALADALKKQPSKVSDGPRQPEKAPKKVKTNKALETAKSSWQDFQKKTAGGKAGKVTNKESMFRTGESATARVGFTGSGTAMRKDTNRARHVYNKGNLDDN